MDLCCIDIYNTTPQILFGRQYPRISAMPAAAEHFTVHGAETTFMIPHKSNKLSKSSEHIWLDLPPDLCRRLAWMILFVPAHS